MGSYGIGVERIVAAFMEQNIDEHGNCWNTTLAPYQTHIIPVNYKNQQVRKTADDLYQKFSDEGIECLLDDRDFSPGFKFRDADLLGVPIQVILGEKNLHQNLVEIKFRKNNKKDLLPIKECVSKIKEFLYGE